MSEADVIKQSNKPQSKTSIKKDLQALGLKSGDIILVHSSMSKIGWIAGREIAVIEALLEVVGLQGTIVMPSFTGENSQPELWQNPPVPASWVDQIKNEMTLTNIKKMFMAEIGEMQKKKEPDDGYAKKVLYILNRLGMSGEKGGDDILRICQYLHSNNRPISQVSIGQLCEILSESPKNMEQRVRRAIAVGMSNLAHLGIEDFMNETFTSYSSTLFPFEEIRSEMDFIRGKRKYGGKVSIKKFIDSLMLAADREL